MRIGIDLGGTKIEVLALDGAGHEIYRRRRSTPRGDYGETVAAIVSLIREAEEVAGRAGSVGIGIPGIESPGTGLIKNANSTWLLGRPLRRDIEEALGRPIFLENDANCFALSEAADGAGADAEVVFGVILGTGVGGGIVARGRLLPGRNAIAGEWGHNPLPWAREEEWPGRRCWCGRSGCIETWLSGPALTGDHREHSGQTLDPPEIAARSASGDAVCRATLHRYVDRLARGLAIVLNLLDPDVVILGGGLSGLDLLYDEVPARWGEYVFSDQVETSLLRAVHGDSSGVRGAAALIGTSTRNGG